VALKLGGDMKLLEVGHGPYVFIHCVMRNACLPITNNLRHLNEHIFASTSVRFRPTTLQMPKLALTETWRITV
jgi:hypothetical protein